MNGFWKTLGHSVRRRDTPSQLALGVALGLMIGILPKDSLLPWCFALFGILSPANLLTMTLSALVCSMPGTSLDPIAHPVGMSLLTSDATGPLFQSLQQLPVSAWARWDNTVVTGLLALGLTASVPAYFVALGCFKRFFNGDPIDSNRVSNTASHTIRPTLLES